MVLQSLMIDSVKRTRTPGHESACSEAGTPGLNPYFISEGVRGVARSLLLPQCDGCRGTTFVKWSQHG